MEDAFSIFFALSSATLSRYFHSCFSLSSVSARILRIMTCTCVFPFHWFFSRLTTSEIISPEAKEILPCFVKFHKRQDTQGSSISESFIWFFSLPMIDDSPIVTSSRSQSGRGFPMPNGRNRSISPIVSTVMSLGNMTDSRESFFFGKYSIAPYFSIIFSQITF